MADGKGRSRRRCAPPSGSAGTLAFLAMAAALGAGSGAPFALVALRTPADQVGSVTGVVGVGGGLGGVLPSLVVGSLHGRYGTWAAGLALLAIVAAAALVLTLTRVRAATDGGAHKPGDGGRSGRSTA